MFKITVLYPKSAADHFDLEYYLNTHTPLIKTLLGPEGMLKVEVEEGIAGAAPGTDATYTIICGIFFPDPDMLEKAMDNHGMELISDIPNFTSVIPAMQVSKVY